MAPVQEDIRGDALDSNMEAILAVAIIKNTKVVTLNNALVSDNEKITHCNTKQCPCKLVIYIIHRASKIIIM